MGWRTASCCTGRTSSAASTSPIDVGYAFHGSFLGRKDFLAGDLDFVLSGVPFSAEELTQVNGGASGLIDVPIQVSSMTFVLQRPVPDGLSTLEIRCDPDDPNVVDPTKCLVKKPYTGAVRIPNTNLAAMALKYTGGVTPPLSTWNHPAVLGAMGVPNFTTPLLAGPAPVLRSDQDEMNYYLQQYTATAAPTVWSGLKALETRIQWEPITERLPRQAGASRDGVEQQGQQLALGGGDPSSGTISGFTAGVFAAVPASAVGGVRQAFPKAKLEYVEVQNANGEWVAPTPASIDAAVNAGGAAPLFALSNKVPGAYPLVWVDHLYAPAHGLSLAKTEGMAALIRYVATAGQDAAQPVGEGRLSAPLVAHGARRGESAREVELRGSGSSRGREHGPRTVRAGPARAEDDRNHAALRARSTRRDPDQRGRVVRRDVQRVERNLWGIRLERGINNGGDGRGRRERRSDRARAQEGSHGRAGGVEAAPPAARYR